MDDGDDDNYYCNKIHCLLALPIKHYLAAQKMPLCDAIAIMSQTKFFFVSTAAVAANYYYY